MPKEKINKTNAARLMDKAGVKYELIPYEDQCRPPDGQGRGEVRTDSLRGGRERP